MCVDSSTPLSRWQRLCRTWPLIRFVTAYQFYWISRRPEHLGPPLPLRQVVLAEVFGQWGNLNMGVSRPLISLRRILE
jgi:hypothetical protein